MQTLRIVLRLTHISAGTFWVGAAIFITLFLDPTVRAAGAEGGRFMMKYILQMLALPVIGQVRLIADDYTRVALLSAEFNACYHALRADAGRRLTPRQVNTLIRLDNRLRQLCRQSPSQYESG